jgi:hypothetical protein
MYPTCESIAAMKRLALLLLLASPAFAQTPVAIQNANFQAPVMFTAFDAAGDQWVPNAVPGWTIGPGPGVPGTFAGIVNLVSACGAPAQMLYSNDPAVTQDLGPAQAGTYSFSVDVCNRGDGVGAAATYTISLLDGTTALCSEVGLNSSHPAGQFTTLAQSCPDAAPAEHLIVSLGCSGPQCNFGSVAVTFTTAGPPPAPLTLNIATKLVSCVKCDRTDDTPLSGSLVFLQNNASQTFALASDGTINLNVSISMVTDPVTFTVFYQTASGNQAKGAGWTWTVPRASLTAGVATLGQFSFGGIAFTLNSDGSVSFAGFLPAS